MQEELGKIRNVPRYRQVNNFSGLAVGKCTPTDIDLYLEWQQKGSIFGEIKHRNAPVPYGQRWGLQELADEAYKAGKMAWAVVVQHSVDDCEEEVDVANDCIVRELYCPVMGEWRKPYDDNLQFGTLYREMLRVINGEYGLDALYWLRFPEEWWAGGMS